MAQKIQTLFIDDLDGGEAAGTTGSASWWFRAGRHRWCKDVLFDGRAGQVISAGEQG